MFVRERLSRVLLTEVVEICLPQGLFGSGNAESARLGSINRGETALRILEVDKIGNIIHQGVQKVALASQLPLSRLELFVDLDSTFIG